VAVACGSLEMGADTPEDARRVASCCRAPVYVNHLPSRDLDSLPALAALRKAGLEPVPHTAARRVASREQVQSFLQSAVKTAGVGKVLLIGGDLAEAAGPYEAAAALLRDRLLADCGIQQVGLAGYPEGHPRIPTTTLRAALDEKLALAREQGLAAYVVTQFPLRRIASSSTAPTSPAAPPVCLSTSAWPDPRTRSPCCAMRSAAASAPPCAPCSRKAWARCGSSRTPILASSWRRWLATAAAAAPPTWWACTFTASAGSLAPRAG
jgi:hypothetical protein